MTDLEKEKLVEGLQVVHGKEIFVTGTGQILDRPHRKEPRCAEGCCIHGPSDHTMINLRTHFRYDRYLMERICPHGIGHPDPDHMKWYKRNHSAEDTQAELTHGCDGCCKDAYEGL